LLASFFTAATELRAANITLQGAFASDDAVQLFDIVLNSTAIVIDSTLTTRRLFQQTSRTAL